MRKLLAGLLGLLAANDAEATLYFQTWTGKIVSGVDSADIFGGGDLSGQGFTVTYLFDDSLGSRSADATIYDLKGSVSGMPGTSPLVSAMITIGGISFMLPGPSSAYNDYAELYSREQSNYSETSSEADGGNYSLFNRITDPFGAAYGDPALSFAGDVSGAATNSGWFSHNDELLQFTNLDYSVGIAAVPEPVSWAMMVGGFGMIGAVWRYRRPHARA